jgi:hypothetical protein
MGAIASRTAFVETVEHGAEAGGDMHEWCTAAKALELLGFSVVRFTADEMCSSASAHTLGTTSKTPVIGRRCSMRYALQACGALAATAPLPERPDYPSCLTDFLGRDVKQATLRDALLAPPPVFVKPRGAEHVKRFDGLVLDGSNTAFLDRVPRDAPVWMSEVLAGLVAEWRCYVRNGQVESFVCYRGDQDVPLDLPRVSAAAATLYASADGSAAFALDVGVVRRSSGGTEAQTVLIEVNDGFSLGLYPGCPPEVYAKMMCERWDEMARNAPLGHD